MAHVQLIVSDPPNRITLKALLERAGHEVGDTAADVVITDDFDRAHDMAADDMRVLLLATPADMARAARAMTDGVYGYISLPLQPGEAEIMVSRAVETRREPERPLMTLEDAEAVVIVDTLRRCAGNQAETARILGIGRNTLWRKLKRIRARTSVKDLL